MPFAASTHLRDIFKARAVKYVKRIPTGNPNRPYRYFYSEDQWKSYTEKRDRIHEAVQGARGNPREATPGDDRGEIGGGLRVSEYSEKAIAVTGKTQSNVEVLRAVREAFGGGWNSTLSAWIFPSRSRDQIIELIRSGIQESASTISPAGDAPHPVADAVALTACHVSVRKQHAINEDARRILREVPRESITARQKEILARYEGEGGQTTNQDNTCTGKGLLYEFLTPQKVIDKTWEILKGYIPKGGSVLEPSAGTGRWAHPDYRFDMREIDPIQAEIAKILHPEINMTLAPFEEMFLDERRRSRKPYAGTLYDAAVGNPPYGPMTGKYRSTEGKGFRRYENYFLSRSLDALKEGGILAMIVPSSFLRSGMTTDKRRIVEKAELVDAYRLPNGSFAHTTTGTDLIILRKNTTPFKRAEPFIDDAFFKEHPDRITGETGNKKGRWGQEEWVSGNLSRFLAASITPPVPLSAEHKRAIAEGLAGNQNAAGIHHAKQNRRVVQSAGRLEKVRSSVARAIDSAGERPVLFRQEEFDQKYGITGHNHLEVLKNTSATGIIDPSVPFDSSTMAVDDGGHVPIYLYRSGNIADRLERLEQDRTTIIQKYGQAQYDRQEAQLREVLPARIRAEDIALTPLDPFSSSFILDEGLSLNGAFRSWLRDLDYSIFTSSRVTRDDVIAYVDGDPVTGRDRVMNQARRRDRKELGNRLFRQFVAGLTAGEKASLEEEWNRAFNSIVDVKPGSVPVLSDGLSTTFKGKPYELRSAQLEFAGKFTATGVGCAVHEVGLGKTMTAAIATVNNMLLGRCRRPLFVVPSSILTKWSRDFSSLYPEIPLQVIGTPELNRRAKEGKLNIADGSVTIMSYDAFTALRFSKERFAELTADLKDQMDNPYEDRGKRSVARKKEQADSLAGRAEKGTVEVYFDEAGFDHLTLDEAHNFNNIFNDVARDAIGARGILSGKSADSTDRRANEFVGIVGGGSSSDRGIKMWLAARHILKTNQNRNMLLLTATPFTNNPVQVYSLLSLMAKERLEKMGIYSVRDFVATFVETQTENVMEANGQVKQKQTMRRWKNGHALSSLMAEFFDRKTGEEAEIKRPQLVEKNMILPMTDEQAIMRDRLEELYDRKEDGAPLKSMSLQQLANISPALVKDSAFNPSGPTGVVERSPKLRFVGESVARLYTALQNRGVKQIPGQIIFLPRGVEFFPGVKDYLVSRGIPEDAIAFMRPEEKGKKALDPQKRREGISRFVEIADDFNNPDGKIKVIIGTDTIQEGISLQKNTCAAYNCMMDWNPTNAEQKKGRLWRFGNRQKRAHVFYPLIENSIDTKLAQKHAEKVARINDIFRATGSPFIDTAEINPDEIKLELIRDPARKARFRVEQEITDLRARRLELYSRQAVMRGQLDALREAERTIISSEEEIAGLIDELKGVSEKWQQRIKREQIKHYQSKASVARAKKKRIDASLESIGRTPNEVPALIHDIDKQMKDLDSAIQTIHEKREDYVRTYTRELQEQMAERKPAEEALRELIDAHVEELVRSVLTALPAQEGKDVSAA